MVKGDIVLITFPFSDLTGTKLRPAIVLIPTSDDVTVCFITSKENSKEKWDIELEPSIDNGLKKISFIKPGKIATLQQSLIKGVLGKLNTQETISLDKSLKALFEIKD